MILGIALMTACSSDEAVEVDQPVSWGAADKVVRSGNLYFSSQPDQQALAAAAETGVEMVVNLRLPDEADWDEEGAARELGLQYFNVPVSKDGPGFDHGAIEMLHELAAANSNKKILMHCSSGNRASAWYALNLVEQHGMDLEQALIIAGQTGLTKPALEARVREHLSEQ